MMRGTKHEDNADGESCFCVSIAYMRFLPGEYTNVSDLLLCAGLLSGCSRRLCDVPVDGSGGGSNGQYINDHRILVQPKMAELKWGLHPLSDFVNIAFPKTLQATTPFGGVMRNNGKLRMSQSFGDPCIEIRIQFVGGVTSERFG
ncbi:hypothetical protein Tco_1369986 [Tanacetum coccineum]